MPITDRAANQGAVARPAPRPAPDHQAADATGPATGPRTAPRTRRVPSSSLRNRTMRGGKQVRGAVAHRPPRRHASVNRRSSRGPWPGRSSR